MSDSPAPRVALLDIDGTLLFSNDAHAQAWVEALAEAGHTVEPAEVRRLIGMGSDQLLPKVAGIEKDSEPGEALSKRQGEIFSAQFLPGLRPTPGTRHLLEHMQARGLELVVATSAGPDQVNDLLRKAGVDDLIAERTSSGDVEHSKPRPDIVYAALQSAHCPPESAVMIGDTPYDVEAARHAGVSVIAFRSGGWDDAALHGAAAVYQDPADLLANYDRSPLVGGSAQRTDEQE